MTIVNRRDFLRTTAGAFAAAAPLASAPARRPNVLMMLCDDLGYGDVGCYGRRIRTPNIDGMAASGVRLTDFYAANPVCSPESGSADRSISRASAYPAC